MTHLHLIWSIVSFPLGFWIGNAYAIRRDQRTEFNDIAEPIYVQLIAANENLTPYSTLPTYDELLVAGNRMPTKFRSKFMIAVANLRKANTEEKVHRDDIEEEHFVDSTALRASIDALIPFLRRM